MEGLCTHYSNWFIKGCVEFSYQAIWGYCYRESRPVLVPSNGMSLSFWLFLFQVTAGVPLKKEYTEEVRETDHFPRLMISFHLTINEWPQIHRQLLRNVLLWTEEMAQWVKYLPSKQQDLS